MNDRKAISLINQADKLFHTAKEELARPEEDVVIYMVCHNAYISVHKYLVGYLLKHGLEVPASMSLESMLNHCRQIDARFNYLNLDKLYHTEGKEDVWMDIQAVDHFISLAAQTRELVLSASQPNQIA